MRYLSSNPVSTGKGLNMSIKKPTAKDVRQFVAELDDRLSPSVRSVPTYDGLDMLLQVAFLIEEMSREIEKLKKQNDNQAKMLMLKERY